MNDIGNPTNARSADVFQVNAFGVKYGFEKSRWGHRTRKLRRNRPLAWGQRPERETFMEKTNKFAAYLTEEQKYKINRCQDLDGSRSGTEVIRRAVDFYHDYLTTKHSGAFIPQTIKSYLDGRLGQLEDRVSGLLYKQAVELDMVSGILADSFRFTEDDLRRRRAASVRNVKQTNGRISFEKRVRESWEEDDDQWQD